MASGSIYNYSPEQAELKPKELEREVSDAVKEVPDPMLRAQINPMLKRMTLHVLCMEQTDARQAAECLNQASDWLDRALHEWLRSTRQ